MRPLEEVVAEEPVLGGAAPERAFERVDVVDALAGVDALSEEVLIDVGDRVAVEIERWRRRR